MPVRHQIFRVPQGCRYNMTDNDVFHHMISSSIILPVYTCTYIFLFYRNHSYLNSVVEKITIKRHVLQALVLGSGIDWFQDPEQQKLVLELGETLNFWKTHRTRSVSNLSLLALKNKNWDEVRFSWVTRQEYIISILNRKKVLELGTWKSTYLGAWETFCSDIVMSLCSD